MWRKYWLGIASAGVLLSFGAPAASAQWYDNGVALKAGQNPRIELTGTSAFTSPNGGVHCPAAKITVELTGGTTDAHIVAWSIENPEICEVSGGLVFLTGGTTTYSGSELTGRPTVTNVEGKTLHITGITRHISFTNGFKLTLSSIKGEPSTATPDSATSMKSFNVVGKMTSGIGNVNVFGTGSVIGANAGTYGLVA